MTLVEPKRLGHPRPSSVSQGGGRVQSENVTLQFSSVEPSCDTIPLPPGPPKQNLNEAQARFMRSPCRSQLDDLQVLYKMCLSYRGLSLTLYELQDLSRYDLLQAFNALFYLI